MKVSLLIPTYKDVEALELILESLVNQTYKNFEVIVAEDDESEACSVLLEKFSSLDIKHVSHKDEGNRKAIIMNRALEIVEGEYLIFIDGDTIPYSTFIASHVALAEPKSVLCGRRVNLGDKVSADLRAKKVTALDLENNYFKNYQYITADNSRHYSQGVYFNPEGLLFKFLTLFNKNAHILASNFSCYREDMVAVNGFDESLPYAPNRDDTDLEWRMIGMGCKMKKLKFCANMFHLNHKRTDRREEEEANMEIIKNNQQKRQYVVNNGIKKL